MCMRLPARLEGAAQKIAEDRSAVVNSVRDSGFHVLWSDLTDRVSTDGERREGEDKETFKARMERLHDENSTNLYIEGFVVLFALVPAYLTYIPSHRLPLSIDEPVSKRVRPSAAKAHIIAW